MWRKRSVAVGLAVPPLVDRGVHQARLGVALALVVDDRLLERAQLKLIGLLAEPQLDGERGVDLLEQRRLRVKGVAGIDDVVLHVLGGLQRAAARRRARCPV